MSDNSEQVSPDNEQQAEENNQPSAGASTPETSSPAEREEGQKNTPETDEDGLENNEGAKKEEETPKKDTPGEKSEEPDTSPDEIIDKVSEQVRGNRKFSSRIEVIRVCLQKSYGGNDGELRILCQESFESVYNNLKDTDRLYDIIRRLLDHCKNHRKFEDLWDILKEKRTGWYEEYYPHWQKIPEGESVDYSSNIERSGRQDKDNQPHPLSEEKDKVRSNWFFNELAPPEQSLLITVALFEGLNRRHLIEIAQEIEQQIFHVDAQDS